MYLSFQAKFREAEYGDIFNGDMITGKGCQNLKECVVYFLFINEKLMGPFKTYTNGNDKDAFFEMYLNLLNKQVLVIEPRRVSQEILTRKLYLRQAKIIDIERNTIFYDYSNKTIENPCCLPYDITEYDTYLINKILQKKIYVINERQNFNL